MTIRENLLLVTAEECAEVSAVISKMMRFGADNHHPESLETNEHKLMVEYYKLVTMMEMLIGAGIVHDLPGEEVTNIRANKMANVLKYQSVSEALGIIRG